MQVSSGNLPIPNDTGANVLADMNENILALQSNNSGDTAPSVAKAHQTWIDTSGTVDVLKIKGNTDNAAFITLGNVETNMGMMPVTGGTFTGDITTAAGSQTSPSLKIAGVNSGLYKVSNNEIGVSCNGNLITSTHQNGLTLVKNKCLWLNNPNDTAAICIKAQSNLTSYWHLQLPNSDGNAGEVLQTDGSGVTSWTAIQGVPTGTIFPFAGAETNIPGGYLECDGSQKSSSTYSALSTLLGSTYNNGQTPSSGNFFLPDLRGQFIRGWDHGAGVDSGRTRGSTQTDNNKSHTHTVASSSITNSGGDHGHAIRPIRLNQNNGAVNVTLGSGQSYNVGYANSDNQGNITANNAVKNSGNFASSITSTLALSLNTSGTTESRPKNVAMIYIIKT